ncbi:MAG: peptidoglycan L-alanyl-D-glutamate endopeptidase CwlK [Polaribacter sp.]|jgi:peptidoglycan L-alanyl-D-glutamate endopeptidase CwlK
MNSHHHHIYILSFLALLIIGCVQERPKEEKQKAPKEVAKVIPVGIQKLMKAYPDFIVGGTDDSILWYDGNTMLYDDKNSSKSFDALLNEPDLQDHFVFVYPKAELKNPPGRNQDAGRIRYEPFFKKMYGDNPKAVQANFTTVIWLPSTLNKKIGVSKINGVAEQMQKVSNELDGKPHLHKYLENIGGVFNWRKIAGTERLSAHSFGITIDLNPKFAHYWKWTSKNVKESDVIAYQNQIPHEIVAIFEKYGFIWGGKWYHFDTMHFEYRPELLVDLEE